MFIRFSYIMKVTCFFLLILLFCFMDHTIAEQEVCPSWIIPDNRSITGWYHYLYGSEVMCGPDFLLLRFGYCMTYNNTTGATEHGACPYIGHYNTTHVDDIFYIQLPLNVSLLHE